MVVLAIPEGPSGIAVIVCPAREPAAAGAGGSAGPWGAGGAWLLTENLYGGIHRGTVPTGRRETRRRVRTAGGKYAGKREESKKQKYFHSHRTLRPLKLVGVKRSFAVKGTVICQAEI